jgi:hypothetical protein
MTRNVTHFELTPGTDFAQSFLYADPTTGLPINLTGYSATMVLKEGMNDNYDGYWNGDSLLTLSTTTGELAIDGVNGLVTVNFSADQTETTLWNRAVYTLILTTPQGKKIPFMNGFVTLLPATT